MRGVRIDLNQAFTADARRRVSKLNVSDRVTIVQGSVAQPEALLPDPAQRFDIVSCVGATWIGGGL